MIDDLPSTDLFRELSTRTNSRFFLYAAIRLLVDECYYGISDVTIDIPSFPFLPNDRPYFQYGLKEKIL
jgi:hypothetical protein